MDSVPYAVPLELIGLRANDLDLVPENAFQSLTPRDESLIENALAAGENAPLFVHRCELETMRERGQKAEIEALYANDEDFNLSAFIAAKIADDEARRAATRP
jgi:meiotic recombination protein SPO11